MKKLFITCALLTATMISFAQNANKTGNMQAPAATGRGAKPSAEQIAERRSKMYQKQLGLNEDQTKKVYEAELDYVRQELMIREHGGQPGVGQSTQMEMGKDQRFKAALTAEQYAKYESTRPKPHTGDPAAK